MLIKSLQPIKCIHRIFMVLANPTGLWVEEALLLGQGPDQPCCEAKLVEPCVCRIPTKT